MREVSVDVWPLLPGAPLEPPPEPPPEPPEPENEPADEPPEWVDELPCPLDEWDVAVDGTLDGVEGCVVQFDPLDGGVAWPAWAGTVVVVVLVVVVGPTTVVEVVVDVVVVAGGSVVVVAVGEHDSVVTVDVRFDVEDRAAVVVAAERVDPDPPPLLEPPPLPDPPPVLAPPPPLLELPVVEFSSAWPPA
jgi:hypothetical protein